MNNTSRQLRTDWRCIKCTIDNPLSIDRCQVCGAKNAYKTARIKEKFCEINKFDLTLKQSYQRLIGGYINQLSDIYDDVPYIPSDIQSLMTLFCMLPEWDQKYLKDGNFKLSGFINECVERTNKGHGCWENIFGTQIIDRFGFHLLRLKVKRINSGLNNKYNWNSVIIGIINQKFCDKKKLQYKFSYYTKKCIAQQIKCHKIGQIITMTLDFDYNIKYGMLTIDNKYRFQVSKKNTYRYGVAMTHSGLILELIHYGR